MKGGLIILLVFGLSLVATAKPKSLSTTTLQVTLEWIELDHGLLTELFQDPVLVRDGHKLRLRLQELIGAKKASLWDLHMLSTAAGERATVESCREWIFPTEYEPSSMAGSFRQAGAAQAPVKSKIRVPRELMLGLETPTAFKTRNVGPSIQIEPEVKKGEPGRVLLRMSAEQVSFLEMVEYQRRTVLLAEGGIWRPKFERLNSGLGIQLADGRYQFGGVLKREKNERKRLILMVKCDILK